MNFKDDRDRYFEVQPLLTELNSEFTAAEFTYRQSPCEVMFGKPRRPWYCFIYHMCWKFSRRYRRKVIYEFYIKKAYGK